MLISKKGAEIMAYPYTYGMYPTQSQMPGQNYLDRLNAMQTYQNNAQPPVQITRVNGRNGAEALQIPPNSSMLLLDESQPIVWLAQSDGAGYKTCTPYTISPYQAQPEPDYNALNQRITRLEALLDGKSDNATTEQNDSTGGQ